MMPYCSYKRCRRVADSSIGTLHVGKVTGSKDGHGMPWQEKVYVCHKHMVKIIKMLGYKEAQNGNG